MLRRLASHARQNAVAYIALMFSVVGGGGGYALAATTHHTTHKKTTIIACASKRTGELFLHERGRCAKGRHRVRWSIRGPRGATGAAGTPSPSIFAAVNTQIVIAGQQPPAEKGMTVTRDGVGEYTMSITDPTCSSSANNAPTVTASSQYALGEGTPPAGAAPVVYIDQNVGISTQFIIHVGYESSSGTFVPLDYNFDVQDTCLPAS